MPADAQAMPRQKIRYAWENDLSGDRVVMLLTLTHQQFIFGRSRAKLPAGLQRRHRKGRLGDNLSINKKKVACYNDFFFSVKKGLNECYGEGCDKPDISPDTER